AILTGIIADAFGVNASVLVIGLLTIFSAIVIVYRMRCGNDLVRIVHWTKNKLPPNHTAEYRNI
ncbi:MAG TPA: hypothetical protein VKH37_08950, partial [Ferruginibacter sp.]|nr:hypothetical protein [Ferruginibacter sp.]